MGLFDFSRKTTVNEDYFYDYSTNVDSSTPVTGGGNNSITLGSGANLYSMDEGVARAAISAANAGLMSGNQASAANVRAIADLSTAQGWMQLFGLQSALGAMGTTASESIGATERIAGASMDRVTDLAYSVVENEGKLLAANAETNKQAFLTAESLGNNAQNLGISALNASAVLGSNAFGAATALGAQGTALSLGTTQEAMRGLMRLAGLTETLGTGAYDLAGAVAGNALTSAQDTIAQVTDLADSSQSRMADLVTANLEYNKDLAATAATGGTTDLLKTITWIAIAAVIGFVLKRR